jgi:hypothetical protein
MKKLIFVTIVSYFILALSASAVAQSESGNCIRTTVKKGKTTIRKNDKKIAEYPFEIYYRTRLWNNAFYYYYANQRELGLVLNCDGKIVLDSITQVGYAIEKYDSTGGQYENNRALIVFKANKCYLYDFDLKPYPNGCFDDIYYSIDRHLNKRPDLFPNVAILQCLNVYNVVDGKKQYGIYELHKRDLIMQPKYEKNNDKNNNIIQYGFVKMKPIGEEQEMLFGFFDKNTHIPMSPETYPDILVSQANKNPKIAIKIEDKCYDENGKLISFPANDKVGICGNFFQLHRKGKVGLYDFEGKEVMPMQYDEIATEFCFWDTGEEKIQFVPVRNGNVWVYLNLEDKGIIPNAEYDYAYPVIKNIGKVKIKDQYFLIAPKYNNEQRTKALMDIEIEYDSIVTFVNLKLKDLADRQNYIIKELKNGRYTKDDYIKQLEGYEFWANSHYGKFNKLYVNFVKKWGATVESFYGKSFGEMADSLTEAIYSAHEDIKKRKKELH